MAIWFFAVFAVFAAFPAAIFGSRTPRRSGKIARLFFSFYIIEENAPGDPARRIDPGAFLFSFYIKGEKIAADAPGFFLIDPAAAAAAIPAAFPAAAAAAIWGGVDPGSCSPFDPGEKLFLF